MPKKSADNR
jgi:hypothetical protein